MGSTSASVSVQRKPEHAGRFLACCSRFFSFVVAKREGEEDGPVTHAPCVLAGRSAERYIHLPFFSQKARQRRKRNCAASPTVNHIPAGFTFKRMHVHAVLVRKTLIGVQSTMVFPHHHTLHTGQDIPDHHHSLQRSDAAHERTPPPPAVHVPC